MASWSIVSSYTSLMSLPWTLLFHYCCISAETRPSARCVFRPWSSCRWSKAVNFWRTSRPRPGGNRWNRTVWSRENWQKSWGIAAEKQSFITIWIIEPYGFSFPRTTYSCIISHVFITVVIFALKYWSVYKWMYSSKQSTNGLKSTSAIPTLLLSSWCSSSYLAADVRAQSTHTCWTQWNTGLEDSELCPHMQLSISFAAILFVEWLRISTRIPVITPWFWLEHSGRNSATTCIPCST